MRSAYVHYWKFKNNHSEITFWLQHLVLCAWSWIQEDDKYCLISYSCPVNEVVLSKPGHFTWKRKQNPSHPVFFFFLDWPCGAEFILCHRAVLWVFRFFFFFCLIVPYDLGRKKKKPTWKCVQSGKCLRAFSVQGVWSKVWMSKLSGWRYRLCSVLCWRWTFFQAIEELKNFCQGLDRPLGGLDGSTGCPPGSSGAGQKARVSNWGPGGGRGPWAAWTAGCWPCLEEAGALRMPICPFLAPVGREKEALIWIA